MLAGPSSTAFYTVLVGGNNTLSDTLWIVFACVRQCSLTAGSGF